MNIKELKEIVRQVVREEVRSGMSEMLREILTEAVEIASKPETKQISSLSTPSYVRTIPAKGSSTGPVDLMDILQETQRSMSREDYSSVMEGNKNVDYSTGVNTQASGEMVVESMEDLPAFAKNAKAIFDASFKK